METWASSLADVSNSLGIPLVDESRRYWMVRTNSGLYYQDFITNNYIAINWDYITPDMLLHGKEEDIKKVIKRHDGKSKTDDDGDQYDSNSGTITGIYTKLQRFIKEFQAGDIVVVPSRDTDFVTIGVIDGDVYLDDSYVSEYLKKDPLSVIKLCPYQKRRNVKWLKTISKARLDIYLQKGLSSHHAVSNIDDYAQYINRSIYDIYQKGNEMHAIFRTSRTDGITLFELKDFFNGLSDLIDDACKVAGGQCSTKDVDVKLNIHSPGIIEVCTYIFSASAGLAMLVGALNHFFHGGKLNFRITPDENGRFTFEMSSESKGMRKLEIERAKIDKMCEIQKRAQIEAPKIETVLLVVEPKKSAKKRGKPISKK